MNVICFGTNAREELLTHLGFDSTKITAVAEEYAKAGTTTTAATAATAAATTAFTPPASVTEPPISPASEAASAVAALDISAEDLFGADAAPPAPPAPAPEPLSFSLQTTPIEADANTNGTPAPASVMDFSNLTDVMKAKITDLVAEMNAAEEAEQKIREAIIVGNFEAAVDCCLHAGMLVRTDASCCHFLLLST
jgi:hypothetical protein